MSPTLAPRLILESTPAYEYSPVRVYSDANGAAVWDSLAFMASGEFPLPLRLRGEAEREVHSVAATANEIYAIDLFCGCSRIFGLMGI